MQQMAIGHIIYLCKKTVQFIETLYKGDIVDR